MVKSVLRLLSIAALLVAAAVPALAQGGAKSYEELIKMGESAVIGSDWNACVEHFSTAHAQRKTEVTFLALGRCELERGRFLDALRFLQEGMRFSLTEGQRKTVVMLTERARQQLGRYRVELEPSSASLMIAGQQVVPDAEGHVWLQIGTHPVTVSAPGHESFEGEVTVESGADGSLRYALKQLEEAPLAPPVAPPEASEEPSDFPVVPVVVASIGGAMLIGSIVTGVLALGHESDLEDRCDAERRCDISLKNTRDGAGTLAIVTDVLWIGGAAAVTTGALLLLLGSDGDEGPAAQASVHIGPGEAAIVWNGRF
ncbi:MAG: PEGA domain-containing protein [Myxococcales bacterium]|nr:PEGA domain-containing protein [Myxococcales bacterium]